MYKRSEGGRVINLPLVKSYGLNPQVASPFHVLVAANRAMCQELHGTVITKNVFSQTIYCMSPSTNVRKLCSIYFVCAETSP